MTAAPPGSRGREGGSMSPWRWPAPASWRDESGPRPLLMLTTSYPSPSHPIAGHFVQTLARALVVEGHQVSVLTPASASGGSGVCVEAGVRVVRVSYPGWRRGPFHGRGLPELLEAGRWMDLSLVVPALACLSEACRREVSALGPRTLLLGHWLVPGGLLARGLGMWSGVESSVICHSGGVRLLASLPRPLGCWLWRLSWSGRPAVVSCGALLEVLEGLAGESLSAHVAPMPVEAPRRCEEVPVEGPWQVTTMGRLVPVKGLDMLLSALGSREVAECGVATSLRVCGEGPEGSSLKGQAAALLEGRPWLSVDFRGLVLGEEKARVWSTTHGFVLSSRRLSNGRTEGAPVAVREAMSYEVPVLATRVGGVSELLAGYRWAVLCEPEEGALARAWPRFLEMMSRRWGR